MRGMREESQQHFTLCPTNIAARNPNRRIAALHEVFTDTKHRAATVKSLSAIGISRHNVHRNY